MPRTQRGARSERLVVPLPVQFVVRKAVSLIRAVWFGSFDLIKEGYVLKVIDFMDERDIKNYHAHIYYDPDTREAAKRVRSGLAANFNVQLGSWHEEPVGPHPKSMYQAVFAPSKFGTIVPWLMLNRQGLTVLVHPSTGASLEDHLERGLWLGGMLKLREGSLRHG